MKSHEIQSRWRNRIAQGVLVGCGVLSLSLGQAQEEEDLLPIEGDNDVFVELIEDLDPGLLQQLEAALGDDLNVDFDVVEDDPFAPFGFSGRVPQLQLTPGMVKTDTDAEALLDRAEAFAKQGRYDLASKLWQQAIEQSSDALLERLDWQDTTRSGNIYRQLRPMLGEIEASMARTIREGLVDYRLKIDGDARALLARATPEERESALAEVVLRYFLSSVGDDAAFELGCLKMERGEFLPASRLFAKILDEYPEPSVELVPVEIRLAGSLARVGQFDQALEMVAGMHADHPEYRRILDLVRQDIEAVRASQGKRQLSADVLTTPANVQPALAQAVLPKELPILWQQSFSLTLPKDWPVLPESPRDPLPQIQQQIRNMRNGQEPPKAPRLEDRWQTFFMPAGQMLVQEGRVYFKTDDRLAVCDTGSGSLQWLGFRNRLELAESVRLRASATVRTTSTRVVSTPNTPEEFLVFGDRVHQSMTLAGDALYVLQGAPLDFSDNERGSAAVQPRVVGRQQLGRFNQQAAGRFRDNRLVCYDAVTGKLQWYRRATEPLDPNAPMLRKAGFSRAPLPYGNLLLVPVHENTALWLVGLDRKTGETRWRTFLCDEPPNQCHGLSPVALAMDAGDVYVGSGAGLLSSVDAVSGRLNWTVRYPRQRIRPPSTTGRALPHYGLPSALLDGWLQDRVFPHGNEIVVAGSDFHFLFAVNRRTGKLAWESPRTPFRSDDPSRYVLAAHEGRLYVSGRHHVRCYQTRGGRWLWETRLPSESFARGAFTPEAIYIPLESGVAQLDPSTGALVATGAVAVPQEDEPVGNLFTDGERLLVYGLKKVYALGLSHPTDALN